MESEKLYTCQRCQKMFRSVAALDLHIEQCARTSYTERYKKRKCSWSSSDGSSSDSEYEKRPPRKRRRIYIPHDRKRRNSSMLSPTVKKFKPTLSGSNVSQTSEAAAETPVNIQLKQAALKKNAKVYTITDPIVNDVNIVGFLNNCIPQLVSTIKNEQKTTQALKFQLWLDCNFTSPSGEITNPPRNFKSSTKTVYFHEKKNKVEQAVKETITSILHELEEHEARGSGWSVSSIVELQLRIGNCNMYHLSGDRYVKLPKAIMRRRAVINVKNNDAYCFKYAILSKLYKGKKNNISVHEIQNIQHKYNFIHLTFPMDINSITKFEKQNPGTSVNVFMLDKNSNITPLRIVPQEKKDHLDLLYIPTGRTTGHFTYIKNFSRLIRSQITKYKGKIVICKHCYCHKRVNRCTDAWLKEHQEYCRSHKPAVITLPEPGTKMTFKNFSHHVYVPVVVFMDLESTLRPIIGCSNDPNLHSYQTPYQRHEVNSVCSLVKSTLTEEMMNQWGIVTTPVIERNGDVLHNTLLHLIDTAKKVSRLYKTNIPMLPLTKEQEEEFEAATHCKLCNKTFTSETPKCHDHNHLTGVYRNCYCNTCNLNMKMPHFLPVVIHSLSSYDGHFIIKALSKFNFKISVIPSTSERYISFSIRVDELEIRFIDSYRFLPTSLEKLVKALPEDLLLETIKNNPANKLHLMQRKGVYCYDYIDDPARFQESQLPPIEKFYNRLNEEDISKEDYDFALKVWHEMGFKTLGEYHDYYLKLDTTLLADVMEAFRDVCYRNYLIDPLHSYTTPGFSWNSMLLKTQIELELISDYDMYLFVEAAVRGGLVQATQRYARANNQYLEKPEDFIPDADQSYILYADVNNLYGKSLSDYLPTGNHKWMEDVKNFDWRSVAENSSTGYLMEVDIIVPDSVHDKLNMFPPLPTKEKAPGGDCVKLMATLHNKTKYILHYRLLQQAEQLGLQVKNVYRVLQFDQSQWLAQYIHLNTELRQAAKNDFEKDFFKLMTNSIFGKTIENQKNRKRIELVTKPEAFLKYTSKLTYTGMTVIDEGLVAINLVKRKIELNRPIYIGQAVLDLSKHHMYHMYYNVLCPNFNNMTLLYSDTDSFALHIQQDDIFSTLKRMEEHFDFSNLPPEHTLYSSSNALVVGLLKDEVKGRQIFEFVALRPKMYSYRFSSNTEDKKTNVVKKIKGVKYSAVDKQIEFENYMDVLHKQTIKHVTFNSIISKDHIVFTQAVKKLALSSCDDKRVISKDNIKTLAHGHYKTRPQ